VQGSRVTGISDMGDDSVNRGGFDHDEEDDAERPER
jgi:hypothetical protein